MEALHIGPYPGNGSQPPSLWSQEGQETRNRNANRGRARQPRRSQTLHEEFQQSPTAPFGFSDLYQPGNYDTGGNRESFRVATGLPSPISEVPPGVENGEYMMSLSITSDSSEGAAKPPEQTAPRPRQVRPLLPPPRRSYSVTDHEPVPHHHRLSSKMTLLDLPPEVHYAIFDFLDPLDGTCLGLTNKHFYEISKRMYGIVPLSIRRAGPNDMEWAWHLAGRSTATTAAKPAAAVVASEGEAAASIQEQQALEKKALSALRVRGHAYCRKCGISRCELHRHIQDWMGEDYEYCSVRQKFGPKAPEGARGFCYLSNPKRPGHCGRHRVARSHPQTVTMQA